ncbi:MAG TPA: DUF1549 domain-containing protein, partial [Bryobacteraceae bacterium]|nr:DUF1549 domain-containing protein [Bryobacteraceae bacterium]
MHRVIVASLTLLALCVFGQDGGPGVLPQLPAPATGQVDYEKHVRPVLQKRCFSCHGPGQQMAGLRLDDGSAGSSSQGAKVIVAGNSEQSALIHRVVSSKPGYMMPPAGQRLNSDEVSLLRAWIDAGAKVPAAAVSTGTPEQASHWSFRPVVRPVPPTVANAGAVRNEIDNFVLAHLEKQGLQPSPEANRPTLIRRLSFDLTGLPPSPMEIDAFVNDKRPDAYERVVNRLLASPHYGERWARHWLDLARYAESDGYEKDLVRPNAWRYRHWTINALNAGMPFDQFTVEQLAGDLLPNATVEQRVATGFHRNVLTNREAGVDRAEARFEQDVNRTNTVSTVWLGLTTGCAQCHNHKYDPISHKEYYQLLSYSRELEELELEAPVPGELGPYMKARPDYDKRRAEILAEHNVLPLQTQFEAKLREAVANPGADSEWDFMATELKARIDNAVKILLIDPEKRSHWQRERMTDHFLQYVGPGFRANEQAQKDIKAAKEKLAKLREQFTPLTHAMTVVKASDAPKAYIAI